MKNLYSIIKKPLFTEKGSNLKESENKILVEVATQTRLRSRVP